MTDDDIPDFLRLTQQQRNDAWKRTPPVRVETTTPTPPPPAVVNTTKRVKTTNRLARMKQNLDRNTIPEAFREWDHKHSRWVDSRVVRHERLKATAARLGLTLENTDMDKWTIVAYDKLDQNQMARGKTTVPSTITDFELQAKVIKTAKRAGLKKVDRVEVIGPDAIARETWVLDLEAGMLQKVGTESPVPITSVQESKMPRKKVKAKKAKVTNGNGAKKIGVIDTIVEIIKRDRGASREEIVAALTKKFPDRNAESMATTVKIQANAHAKKKSKDDKRGLVYYG